MPLSDAGNKIKRKMEEEYGSKEGEKVFYSKENGDKKFRKLVTGHKEKALWYADRLARIPKEARVSLITSLKSNPMLYWYTMKALRDNEVS